MSDNCLHRKTSIEAQRDFLVLIRDSAIGQTIEGEVLPRGERLPDAKTEDAVLHFEDGNDAINQLGFIDCNIYVADILHDNGEMGINQPRCAEIMDAIRTFVEEVPWTEGYQISTDGTPVAIPEEGTGQHRVYARFSFTRRAF